MTVTEALEKIIQLTNTNLELLGMINESFFTKREHLTAVVDDTRYTIPSFISLENKVNHLQAAFNNLVNSPMTGEAYMNFDGNSRVIQMRGFQQAPRSVSLQEQDSNELKYFYNEESDFFKDMLSPKPYIKLDLSELDDDITQVVVKKIVIYNQNIITTLDPYSSLTVSSLEYPSMQALLTSGNKYSKGQDYDEYDTVYNLPIRQMICSGDYIVSDIISDTIDNELSNIITLQLDESTPAECKLYDGYTTRELMVGDMLTNFDGSTKMQIVDIRQSSRILTVKILSGEYVNILPDSSVTDGAVSDYSKLRFYQAANFDQDKYLKVPLEEDQYIYISVAPLNSRMNVQAPWGTGLVINADSLSLRNAGGEVVEDANGNPITFRDYYRNNVKNIGDTINELAAVLPSPLTNLTPAEFKLLRTAKPYMKNDDDTIDTLKVVQINKHLNEAENIKKIRNLYSQKQQYKIDLEECQGRISTLTAELAEVSFDDMTGSRTMLTAQIDDLKARQNELIKSINMAIDAIALAANDSEVPIEESKFRIRGYVDIDKFLTKNGLTTYRNLIRAIRVRYRYKNPGVSELANVTSFGSDKSTDFLFTEWCEYRPSPRLKTAAYSNGSYIVGYKDVGQTENDIKFNQIEIPITQGEQVDLQVKIIWDFGYPFVNIETDWSDNVTINFPQELVKDVEVTTIIKENNSDIEAYRFENILNNHGITQHSDDYIDDQDTRYYHKPESISSGFYTEERRVIPLSDKLRELNNKISSLQDAMSGTYASNLKVALVVNNTEYELSPDIQNNVSLPAYNSVDISTDLKSAGTSIIKANDGAPATAFGSLNIKNVSSSNTVRLYAMVPGARDIGMTKTRKFQRILNNSYDYAEPVTSTETSDNASSTFQTGMYYAPSLNNVSNSTGIYYVPDVIDSNGHGTVPAITDVVVVGSTSGYVTHESTGPSIVTGGGTTGGGTGDTPPATSADPTCFEYICGTDIYVDSIEGNALWDATGPTVTFVSNQGGSAAIKIKPTLKDADRNELTGRTPVGQIKKIEFTAGAGDYFDIYKVYKNGNTISGVLHEDVNGEFSGENSIMYCTKSAADDEITIEIRNTNQLNYSGNGTLYITYLTGKDSNNNALTKHRTVKLKINIPGQHEQEPVGEQLTLTASKYNLNLNINTSSHQTSDDFVLYLDNINPCIDPNSSWAQDISSFDTYGTGEFALCKVEARIAEYPTEGEEVCPTDTKLMVTYPADNGGYFKIPIGNNSGTDSSSISKLSLKIGVVYTTDNLSNYRGNLLITLKPVKYGGTYNGVDTWVEDNTGYFTSTALSEVSCSIELKMSSGGYGGSTSGGSSGGGNGGYGVYGNPQNYTRGRMVYILNPITMNGNDNSSNLYTYVDVDSALKDTLNEQLCNQFVTFRIRDPFTGNFLGDQMIASKTAISTSETIDEVKGVDTWRAQKDMVDYIAAGNHVFEDSFVYATPATSSVGDICIESDSTHAIMELGPGESVSVPIFIGYVINEDKPLSSYSLGFDIRNSLYNDPLYYHVNLQARYNQSYSDMLQSNKASIRTATNYNPVVRS